VRRGRQGYVVCPLIEESETLDAQAVTSWAEALRERLPGVRLGVLHGRLSPQERERVMEAFREREMEVLVTTTVVEVGVDVPNATVMIVVGADRFGLAQLHQLRGRVGRGSEASYCLLISGSRSPETRQRLRTMVETQDGFRIAEVDLELRGPGEFFGTRQHGMPDFRVAHPVRDLRLLEQAREEARRVVEEGLGEHPLLQREIARRFGERVFAPRTG
jgi:ATP-dependent DNA helicase RecG